MIATFLPIIILVGLIIVLLTVARYVKIKGWRKITAVYCGILLITTVVYYFMPYEKYKDNKVLDMQEMENEELINVMFHDAVSKGTVSDLPGVSKKKEWSFTFEGDSLMIGGLEQFHSRVAVERKMENDQKIEATHFTTKNIIEGIDFTEYLKSPEISLNGDNLIIVAPERIRIEASAYRKELFLNQFIEDKHKERMSIGQIMAQEVIYIRIPNNVELEDSSNVTFIDDNN